MKKRLILTNVIILIITLLLSLTFNAISFTNLNKNSTKEELSNYLNIATNAYQTNNSSEVIALFSDSKNPIRITIIDLDGNVIADSANEEINTNHLYREEIKQLNTFVERKSTTLGVTMLYLATLDDGAYVRVAMEVASINSYVIVYLVNDGMATLILLVVSILVFIYLLKKYLSTLIEATTKLEQIIQPEAKPTSDSLEALVHSIDCASNTINEQMELLKEEKERIIYIINNISHGLIILDEDKNIELINNFALKILNLNLKNILHKNYLYCFRSQEINDLIKDSDCKALEQIKEFTINGFDYQISINKFDDKIAIIMTDITELKKLDTTKREFFQNASHELKSPLTSIIGYQQMIKEGILTEEKEIQDATTKTIHEAVRMNDIIIEMLELSKLESEVAFDLEEVDVSEVITEVLQGFEKKCIDKQIKVEQQISSPKIKGCREHVYMLIRNIIENAIKYNKNEGSIIISLNHQILSIKDTGIGIEEKNIRRIFERFFRVDKAKSKALGSTGLGLAIVKHICKLYNYDIEVTSEIGIGTEVILTLK